ncbi:endonuclease/exonuclease/phosphatase family protein [uncultured Arsenicicoccus sp.]|uniref:endonuclease/exonuclease/phosphatase family protein n=1 Tax=uncultured Arsenicicoccus sp. TaxID=491339 RepID=UPI00259180F5|nr:endonuclease/exonuclease/phosphatase family protein [uncultured Arsenicicoccus sp.]
MTAGATRARPSTTAWSPSSRALLVAGASLALLGTGLLALRWAVVPERTGFLALQALSPMGGVLVGLGVVALLLARAWGPLAVALLPALAYAGLAAPTVLPDTVPPRPDDLVVLSTNLQYGRAQARRVIETADRVDADVVVLVEVTPGALARLDEAGLSGRYPHSMGRPGPRASGLVVRTRDPLRAVTPSYDPRAGTPYGLLSTSRGEVLLRGVHPAAPTSPERWGSDLADLGSWIARVTRLDPKQPVLVAGDLNATYSHPPLRQAVAPLTDAARAAGKGWEPTWPQGRWYPPFAQIDHVLVRNLRVVDSGVAAIPDTDHRAVWARLRVG